MIVVANPVNSYGSNLCRPEYIINLVNDSPTACRVFALLWWTSATLCNLMLLGWWMSRLKRGSGKLFNLNGCLYVHVFSLFNFLIYSVYLVFKWYFSYLYRAVEIICNLIKKLSLNSGDAALMSMGIKILSIMLIW